MNFDDIRRQLETAEEIPETALRAAVAHADELARLLEAVIGRLRDGVYLTPAESNLFFFGVHVLAAARCAVFWPTWREVMTLAAPDLEDLLGDMDSHIATRVTLSLIAQDSHIDDVFDFIENPPLDTELTWAMFDVAARVAWEGRAPLDRVRDLLTRFEREPPIDDDDLGWHGWADAVCRLGLTEFDDALRRVHAKAAFQYDNEADHALRYETLRAAAADFADPRRFDDDGIAPIADPVDGLAWMTRRAERRAQNEPPETTSGLSYQERLWLEGFLFSEHAPESVLHPEELEGFVCALACVPRPQPPEIYLPYVWDCDERVLVPDYVDAAQRAVVEGMIARHLAGIAAALATPKSYTPVLDPDAPVEETARLWAAGFILGVGVNQADWEPLIGHRIFGIGFNGIAALYRDDDPDMPDWRMSRRDRAQLIGNLPSIVGGFAAFLRDPERAERLLPKRVDKIGRNEPCPCGSGKKFKKCCGSGNAPPLLH